MGVALIGETISSVQTLREDRKATFARIAILNATLDEELLDKLEDRAQALRPMVKRDGKGLTELEFVLACVVELGMIDWKQVYPFVKKFRVMDRDGNGRLNKEDLAMGLA